MRAQCDWHSPSLYNASMNSGSKTSFAITTWWVVGVSSISALMAQPLGQLRRTDHFVTVSSTAPSLRSKTAKIYVREVAQAESAQNGSANIVLFIHGAGTPAEVAFDVPYKDYSWMVFLAYGGYDVFSMDMTGYGRSTRPEPMNDPCNLTPQQQAQFVPTLIPKPCAAVYKDSATTIDSDWNDIGSVVDSLLKLRNVKQVSLIGWSLGGPRAGGYAAQHPEKVSRLIFLSPAYRRLTSAQQLTLESPMNTQSKAEFDANWDRQIGCPDQFDQAARDAVWTDMLASDSLGRSWGSGVRRAPNVSFHGWDSAVAGKMTIPAMFVSPAEDKQVPPKAVSDLFLDYGAQNKILLDLACSSHNALWENNHLLLFQASLEFLKKGTVNGVKDGTVRAGYRP